jgi:hypothetical protein
MIGLIVAGCICVIEVPSTTLRFSNEIFVESPLEQLVCVDLMIEDH